MGYTQSGPTCMCRWYTCPWTTCLHGCISVHCVNTVASLQLDTLSDTLVLVHWSRFTWYTCRTTTWSQPRKICYAKDIACCLALSEFSEHMWGNSHLHLSFAGIQDRTEWDTSSCYRTEILLYTCILYMARLDLSLSHHLPTSGLQPRISVEDKLDNIVQE